MPTPVTHLTETDRTYNIKHWYFGLCFPLWLILVVVVDVSDDDHTIPGSQVIQFVSHFVGVFVEKFLDVGVDTQLDPYAVTDSRFSASLQAPVSVCDALVNAAYLSTCDLEALCFNFDLIRADFFRNHV